YYPGGCTTQSIVMRSKSGTVRMIEAYHRLAKLNEYSAIDFTGGKYLSLTQSNADEAALVASIKPDSYASGTQDVDGVTWVVYESSDPEPVWTTKLSGPAQVAITGAGGTDEYRTLASATQKQSPLPIKRP
ncbi:DUF4245 family protein, partial [Mycolicibacterium senegalense]|uniref:DUF4245 family protein n=1 Tax=Mycolicibacterium senegalense TaxID=1796 RepID=UPI00363751D7